MHLIIILLIFSWCHPGMPLTPYRSRRIRTAKYGLLYAARQADVLTIVPPPSTSATVHRCTADYWILIVVTVDGRERHSVVLQSNNGKVHRIGSKFSRIYGYVDRIVGTLTAQGEAPVFHRQPLIEIVHKFESRSACSALCHLVNLLQTHPIVPVIDSKSRFVAGPS